MPEKQPENFGQNAAIVDALKEALETLRHREKMANTLNRASVIFLSQGEGTFEAMMTAGVGLIVDMLDLDRITVWRNSTNTGVLCTSQIYRWDRESGGTTPPPEGLEDIAFSSLFPNWKTTLAADGTINGPVRLQPEPESAILKKHGIKSAFVTPVFINKVFWGFVFFGDLRNERCFEDNCTEIMRLAAFLCANIVMRTEMEKNIQEQNKLLKVRLEQQELISEITRGLISSGDSETHIKKIIAKLGLHYKASRVFIFSIECRQDGTYPMYYWSNDRTALRRAEIDLLSWIKNSFPETLPATFTLPFISCADIAASPIESFRPLLDVDVNAFMCVPFYLDGHLWGVISVEQCHTPRQWTENEKTFVAMAANTISGVIMRNIYTSKLKNALDKATEANKAKSDFLSNMSHEIRTPLNAIIGMTMIGKNAPLIDRKNYALDMIQDASTQLLGVINDVLDMSKIAENKLELSCAEFNFERLLQKATTIFTIRMEEKNLDFKLHIDRDIPETLIGDDQRLTQVITNLLGNAVKFTPASGSISLDTRFVEEKGGNCAIQFSVRDTGIGISEEQQKHLFEPFQQAESSTSRKYGGTGLGLAISKSIVEMMKGEIRLESEPGKGSVFTFTVRMKRGTEKKRPVSISENGEEGNHYINDFFDGYCVLLVEDIEINRDIVLALLEPAHLEIDCAENGKEAVRMFVESSEKYDLIFMDIQMPEMDGYEATRRIRALGTEKAKSIPIIAMTANAFVEDVEKCLEAGMNSHVGKPLNIQDVIERLRCYLPKRRNV